MDDEWRLIEQGYVETCEQVLSKAKAEARLQNTCKPVRHEAGVLLRSAEEEMHQWREQFQTVLNHEEQLNLPEVEPNGELHIKHIEIKNAIKELKNGKAAACDNNYTTRGK